MRSLLPNAQTRLIRPSESRPSSPRGYKYTLFVSPKDAETEQWEGNVTGVDDAVEIFGADEVNPPLGVGLTCLGTCYHIPWYLAPNLPLRFGRLRLPTAPSIPFLRVKASPSIYF